MNSNDPKPTISGEMRAVQERLHDKSAPRTSRWAPMMASPWTPILTALAALITAVIPQVQQAIAGASVVECQEQTQKLEERIEKLERERHGKRNRNRSR